MKKARTRFAALAVAFGLAGCGAASQGLPSLAQSFYGSCPMMRYDAIAWSPDGNLIAYNAALDGSQYQIYLTTLDGSGTRQLSTAPNSGTDLLWSPDSQRIAYRLGHLQLHVMTMDGKETQLADDVVSLSWSPDSQFIGYSARVSNILGQGAIFVTGLDGSEGKAIIDDLLLYGGVEWSPDGESIAFHMQEETGSQIFVTRTDGSQTRQLTYRHGQFPRWSPDSSKISYESIRGGLSEIHMISADGTGDRLIVTHYTQTPHAWLPDGRHIAFVAMDNGTTYLTVINIDTLVEERIGTIKASPNMSFSWSPDGSRVAFIDDDYTNPNATVPEMFIINRDGTGLTRLTDNPGKRYCLSLPF